MMRPSLARGLTAMPPSQCDFPFVGALEARS